MSRILRRPLFSGLLRTYTTEEQFHNLQWVNPESKEGSTLSLKVSEPAEEEEDEWHIEMHFKVVVQGKMLCCCLAIMDEHAGDEDLPPYRLADWVAVLYPKSGSAEEYVPLESRVQDAQYQGFYLPNLDLKPKDIPGCKLTLKVTLTLPGPDPLLLLKHAPQSGDVDVKGNGFELKAHRCQFMTLTTVPLKGANQSEVHLDPSVTLAAAEVLLSCLYAQEVPAEVSLTNAELGPLLMQASTWGLARYILVGLSKLVQVNGDDDLDEITSWKVLQVEPAYLGLAGRVKCHIETKHVNVVDLRAYWQSVTIRDPRS